LPHQSAVCTSPSLPAICPAHILWLFRDIVKFLRQGVVSTSADPQAGGPPLIGCSRLLIQFIRSYPPYLEAVPPSATWGCAMPWRQGPTHNCDRDPLITVTGTQL
jgi:hypothetical protein